MSGEAFRDPLDLHKMHDFRWPSNSEMFRFEPPIRPVLGEEQGCTFTHGVVAPLDSTGQIGLIAVSPDGELLAGGFVLLALAEMDQPETNAFLAKIGYPDVYDEEF